MWSRHVSFRVSACGGTTRQVLQGACWGHGRLRRGDHRRRGRGAHPDPSHGAGQRTTRPTTSHGAGRSTPGAAHPTTAYLVFLGARRGSVGFAVDGPLVGPVLLRGRRRRAPLLGRPVRL